MPTVASHQADVTQQRWIISQTRNAAATISPVSWPCSTASARIVASTGGVRRFCRNAYSAMSACVSGSFATTSCTMPANSHTQPTNSSANTGTAPGRRRTLSIASCSHAPKRGQRRADACTAAPVAWHSNGQPRRSARRTPNHTSATSAATTSRIAATRTLIAAASAADAPNTMPGATCTGAQISADTTLTG
ncbi:hypothetical protein BamIOP4010DRAFT_6655 [Burkholderia ambifaria IOP40-10]|uniref:Uncharacterized protein n=1 Tax=Burkholderia ambifaria IOP40-10 TaxID=396596 RepID=B1FRJ4_9BURK|nr:hypothetical protein BamIOP4010DRAFT_6655 [Burkholderia ambifaria IOP40-10]